MYRLGVVAVRSNEYPLLATQYQIHECISFWVFRCFYIINDFVFGLSTNLFEDAANPHDFPLNRCNCAELILFIQFAFLPTHKTSWILVQKTCPYFIAHRVFPPILYELCSICTSAIIFFLQKDPKAIMTNILISIRNKMIAKSRLFCEFSNTV